MQTELEREHEQLDRDVDALHDWWQECREYGVQRFGEMGARIEELRSRLAAHFAWEEEGGYLRGVLEVVPRLTKQGESLRRQHAVFLAELDQLVATLRSCEPAFESWTEARKALDVVLERLEQHEHAERELVQEAVEVDVGTGD